MTGKPEFIASLDIGTNKISVVVAARRSDGAVDVVGLGQVPSRGLRKGVVINIEATVQAIMEAVTEAEKMAGVTIKSVVASLSGSHVKGFNSNGIVPIRHKEVRPTDIEKVIETAKAVTIPMDREILHVIPQEFIVDDQDGIKDPLGISGVRLEAKVHIVSGAAASAQNIVKCANRCGLTVQDLVVAPLASGQASLTPEERDLGVCIIDIGGGTSDLAVFRDGAIQHSCVVPLGGNHITNDLAAGLRAPIAVAEEIKKQHGVAFSGLAARDENIELPLPAHRGSRNVSQCHLAGYIEPRVVEMFNLLHAELVRTGMDEHITSGVVLTGGTSRLSGVTEAAEQIFNVPVRLGLPLWGSPLPEQLNAPESSTALGLIAHALQGRRVGTGRSIGSSQATNVMKKVVGWFERHF